METISEEMKTEFVEILYKLYAYDDLVTAEISSFIETYSVFYLAGIEYASKLNQEQWDKLKFSTDCDKWKDIFDENVEMPEEDEDSDDEDEEEGGPYEEESIDSFICGIFKVGRDKGVFHL